MNIMLVKVNAFSSVGRQELVHSKIHRVYRLCVSADSILLISDNGEVNEIDFERQGQSIPKRRRVSLYNELETALRNNKDVVLNIFTKIGNSDAVIPFDENNVYSMHSLLEDFNGNVLVAPSSVI